MAEVYARRWDIEMALSSSTSSCVLWCQGWDSPADMGDAHNFPGQALRLEIAHKAGVDPFEVSIGLLVQYEYAYEG